MQYRMTRFGVAVVFFVGVAAGSPLRAQELEVLASFEAVPAGPSGGLAVGLDGLYGTAEGGAYNYGVVYRFVPPSTEGPSSLTMLHSFVDTDAAADLAKPTFPPTLAADGDLYGIRGGWPYGGLYTAVYRITASGEQTLVRRFQWPEDGYAPGGPLVAVGGLLYGACGAGGLPGQNTGTIFVLSTTGDFEVVHRFEGGSGGANPLGGLLLRPQDGRLYGVTAQGGEFSEGTIFRFDPATAVFETLHSFDPVEDGYWQSGELTAGSDGMIYGVVPRKADGLGTCGSVFRLDPDAPEDGLAVVHTFSCDVGEPKEPIGGMAVVDGFLYGVTEGETVELRRAPGSIYRIDLGSGALEVLHTFEPDDYFQGVLVAAPDGFIYGQSRGDGLFGADAGSIFRIDPATGGFAMLYEFGPAEGPRRPNAVVEGPAGGLFASSLFGGPSNLGTVFRVLEEGDVELVHAFDDGRTSSYGLRVDLTSGSDGLVYGTRNLGGAFGTGSIFTIDPNDGGYRLLHSFDGTVRNSVTVPDGALIESRNEPGVFYGTLSSGWGFTGGVYELSRDGVTILAAFHFETGISRGRLVQTADGSLFGVLNRYYDNAGWWGYGGLFRAAPEGGGGRVRNLEWFEGQDLHAGMIEREARDGSGTVLYGTAPDGGEASEGTVFRLSSEGEFSVVHSFSGADGAEPWAEMALAADGTLYGTTRKGGVHGYGTIFAVTPDDEVVTVHHFDHHDGAWPEGALFTASDGNVYGTTAGGGPGGGGVVFRYVLQPDLTVEERIEELIIDVEELIEEGVINNGRGRSLIAELQVALWFLQWNNGERQAIVRLDLFIKKVEIMVRTNQLDPDLGAELIAKAEAILEMLRS